MGAAAVQCKEWNLIHATEYDTAVTMDYHLPPLLLLCGDMRPEDTSNYRESTAIGRPGLPGALLQVATRAPTLARALLKSPLHEATIDHPDVQQSVHIDDVAQEVAGDKAKVLGSRIIHFAKLQLHCNVVKPSTSLNMHELDDIQWLHLPTSFAIAESDTEVTEQDYNLVAFLAKRH